MSYYKTQQDRISHPITDIEKQFGRTREEYEFPVGTIRRWKDGDFIKMDNLEWILVNIPKHFKEALQKVDRVANSAKGENEPISGMRLLDHEIDEHFKREGENEKYKKYLRHGTMYDFEGELTLRWMEAKMNKKMGVSPTPEFPTMEEVEVVNKIVTKVHSQLKQGFKFTGKQKEVYDEVSVMIKSLEDYGEGLIATKNRINKLKDRIDKVFSDNWGVRITASDRLDDGLKEYLDKFKERIRRDTGKEQAKEFGTAIEAPMKEFYGAIQNKISEYEESQEYEDKVDKRMEEWDKKRKGEKKLGGETELRIKTREDISEEELLKKVAFDELLFLRFELVLDMALEGEWKTGTLPAIANFETMITQLPRGHVLNNDYLQKLENHGYAGGQKGYASYNNDGKLISLSNEVVGHAGIIGELQKPNEFRAVLAHEIGHAVSAKLKEINDLEWRRFAMLTGWSNEQPNLKATGQQRDVERLGRFADRPLISKYANKSPEEAFAEYYSFYYLNSEAIDKWLETDEVEHISQIESTEKRKKRVIETDPVTGQKKLKGMKEVDVKVKGLGYADTFVSASKLLKNRETLSQMRNKVFKHKELIKALVELGAL